MKRQTYIFTNRHTERQVNRQTDRIIEPGTAKEQGNYASKGERMMGVIKERDRKPKMECYAIPIRGK